MSKVKLATLKPCFNTEIAVKELVNGLRSRIELFRHLGYITSNLSVSGKYIATTGAPNEACVEIYDEDFSEQWPRIMPISIVPISTTNKEISGLGIYEFIPEVVPSPPCVSNKKDMIIYAASSEFNFHRIPDKNHDIDNRLYRLSGYPVASNPGLAGYSSSGLDFVIIENLLGYNDRNKTMFKISSLKFLENVYGTPLEVVDKPIYNEGVWMVPNNIVTSSSDINWQTGSILYKFFMKWKQSPELKITLLNWVLSMTHMPPLTPNMSDDPIIKIPYLNMVIPRSEIQNEITNLRIQVSVIKTSIEGAKKDINDAFGCDEEDDVIIPGAIGRAEKD